MRGTTKELAVRTWLGEYGLSKYCEKITNAGYNSMRFLLAAREEDIWELTLDISMERGHAKVLVGAWADLLAAEGNYRQSASLSQSSTSQSPRPIQEEREGLFPTLARAAMSARTAGTPRGAQQVATIGSEESLAPSGLRGALSRTMPKAKRKYVENNAKYMYRETADEKMLRLFNETDADSNGVLDMREIKMLCRKLGDRMSKAALREAFDRMDPDMTGEVGFDAFLRWRKLKMDMYRRDLRANVRQVFEMVDESGDGVLDMNECATMMDKIGRKFQGVDFDPPFCLQDDFAAMDVQNRGVVSWDEFLDWFKKRTGDDEPDVPVLPEYMVRKVLEDHTKVVMPRSPVERSKSRCQRTPQKSKSAQEKHRSGVELWSMLRNRNQKNRSGLELWAFLRPRLGMIVKLQKQWGTISSLYEGKRASVIEFNAVPRFIRDPDSTFCAYWDIMQVCGKGHQQQLLLASDSA